MTDGPKAAKKPRQRASVAEKAGNRPARRGPGRALSFQVGQEMEKSIGGRLSAGRSDPASPFDQGG